MNNRSIIVSGLVGSVVAFVFLLWVIYVPHDVGFQAAWTGRLPMVNAFLNSLSAVSVCFGIVAIMRGKIETHRRLMMTALIFSALFLVTYVVYHTVHGDVRFLGQGIIRPIYFFTLISHIILTIFALPLILITVGMALFERYGTHKKLARWTFPVWLYVSVTGVLIYLIQRWGQ
ncbi:DUF420 domain-containing protein [bacterium]|nr:DUF420 domain-containing protein [bacterium]